MLFKKNKKMYQYKPFEQINSNLSKLSNEEYEVTEVCDNEKYTFYECQEKSVLPSTYVVYQIKNNPKKIYMIGNGSDYATVYKNNLFLCDEGGEVNRERTLIRRYDLEKKQTENYNLRWKLGKWISINGYGRFHTTDNYLKMQVENDELVIYVHREKSNAPEIINDEENCDMDYEVIFKYENDEFVPYFRIDGKYFSLVRNN